VARCLIVGCGCRGRALAAALRERGHAVRGTTRDPARLQAIEAAGADGFLADPDRIATLSPALEHVTVTCVLLGSAVGQPATLAELHGPRLEMLLSRMLDTTVRGIVYESAGSVDAEVLAAGASLVSEVCKRSRIPYALLATDPAQPELWVTQAGRAVDEVLK
jgi:uncharacterized protein YbjT (DUF2867 family)